MNQLFKRIVLLIFSMGFVLLGTQSFAGALKDTESASHSDAASAYDIVDTYTYPGFRIIQFNLAVLSHYSYMLISGNQALVVDPGRDVFTYLDIAQKENAQINGVLLTHSHADFVAGHTELAKKIGCPVYISEKADAGYPHTPLKDGSVISIGSAELTVLETPGHTLDCTTAIVYSTVDGKKSQAAFTGDTLFVGSIGRPDLMGGTISAAALASMSFDTWQNKLSKIEDHVAIYPAHGAGSLCGAHLSDDPFSTFGRERETNHYLKFSARSDFIAAVLEGLPDAPQYFKYNAALNQKGPELIDWKKPAETIAPDMRLTDLAEAAIVDLRDAELYAKGHIPNAVNIALRGRLETWVGIMIPWGVPLILTGNQAEIDEASYRLNRVGYGGARSLPFDSWVAASLPVKSVDLMAPQDLYTAMKAGNAPVIVDVRLPAEWMGLRIGQVINMPLNQLANLSGKLDPAEPVVAVCNSAYRSSLALGILEQKGFSKVTSLKGGSQAWIDAGFPVFGSDSQKSPSLQGAAEKKEIRLPGRISSTELKSLIMDLPGTFDLVDIRPPSAYADFHLPQSMNVDLADLLANPAHLVGAGPLIIVDRDGALAMMAAGMLFSKTKREIKALRGGVEGYWRESAFQGGSNQTTQSQKTLSAPAAAPAGNSYPKPAAPLQEIPEKPKKKSAGC